MPASHSRERLALEQDGVAPRLKLESPGNRANFVTVFCMYPVMRTLPALAMKGLARAARPVGPACRAGARRTAAHAARNVLSHAGAEVAERAVFTADCAEYT